MRASLPVGTYVLIKDPGCRNTRQRASVWYDESDDREWLIEPHEYYAIVVGYDMFFTKYEVGRRFGGWGEWLFGKGGDWTFPAWCTEVTEEEARRLPDAGSEG